MAAIKKIEERTRQFIDCHTKLKRSNQMVTHEELAKIIGVESKTTISEILGKRQNIQPDQWEAFRKHFKISSDIPVHEPGQSSISVHNPDGTLNFIELKTASGKHIQIKPEGQTELVLLNAFLEERDKVIEELQIDKKKLQNTIDVNLTAMMQLLGALSRHDRAFHDTMLRSLARLEGKQEVDLIAEARSSEAAKQVEEMTGSSNA